MDLARVLAADLRDLAVDLSANAYTRQTLAMLQLSLYRQVPSALGAVITLTDRDVPGCPIGINLLVQPVEPHEIAAALLIPLDVVEPPCNGNVVFYATTPTAFAELAPALAAALDVDPGSFNHQPDLPHTSVVPGITGLMDFSAVNRAVGVLVNRGRSLTAARTELQRRADKSQTDLPTAAQTLLNSPL